MAGLGPARPIKFSYDGPRPGPARPGPVHHSFNFSWPSPARPSKNSNVSPRPGLVHDIGGEAHETPALYGSARLFCGPARGFSGPDHGLAHVLSRTKRCMLTCVFITHYILFVSLILLDSVGQLHPANEAYVPTRTHNPV